MKVIKDSLDIEFETWSDPGDYPNAVASGPLPSFQYIEEVSGEVVIELEDDEQSIPTGLYKSLEEINHDVFEYLSENELSHVKVISWDVVCSGNTLSITVGEFELDGDYEPPETDYEPCEYYD